MSAGSAAATFGNGNTEEEGKTMLGMVVTLCIKRYYEIFGEYVDRSEAVKPWWIFGHPADVPDEGPRGAGVNGNGHAAENAAGGTCLGRGRRSG